MSGAVVGRGYRNLPALTASRFVTYIGASGEPQRIYRTGDRVRLLENGEFEFFGRFDDQVKLRGCRIELAEIVTYLNRCPGVDSSAVCIVDASGPALAAYIVPSANAQLSESQVRQYLSTKLPDYMIPTVFVLMPALPLSANGKLDGSALPVPAPTNLLRDSANAPTAPSSTLEAQVADIVAALLGRTSIAEDENFFMAGGHSMLGVQLVASIRDAFGVKLPLRQLFKAPTVGALSTEIARLTSAH